MPQEPVEVLPLRAFPEYSHLQQCICSVNPYSLFAVYPLISILKFHSWFYFLNKCLCFTVVFRELLQIARQIMKSKKTLPSKLCKGIFAVQFLVACVCFVLFFSSWIHTYTSWDLEVRVHCEPSIQHSLANSQYKWD